MGKVAAEIKVMPEEPENDLAEIEKGLRESLPDNAEITDITHEEVAFGLTAIIVNVALPDEEGGTQVVEDAFIEVENVESVSVENVARV